MIVMPHKQPIFWLLNSIKQQFLIIFGGSKNIFDDFWWFNYQFLQTKTDPTSPANSSGSGWGAARHSCATPRSAALGSFPTRQGQIQRRLEKTRKNDGWLVALTCFNHVEKYEFVNGKDDNPYMKYKIKNVWNHQPDGNIFRKLAVSMLHAVLIVSIEKYWVAGFVLIVTHWALHGFPHIAWSGNGGHSLCTEVDADESPGTKKNTSLIINKLPPK